MDFTNPIQHLEVLKACARVFIARACERFCLGGFNTPNPTVRFRKDIPIDELNRVVNGVYQCCYDVYERDDPTGEETPLGDFWYLTRAGFPVWYRASKEPEVVFGRASTIEDCVTEFTKKLDQAEADQ